MLENIGNAISRLPEDRLRRNVGGRIPWSSRHVRRDAVSMATAVDWQRLLRGNGTSNIQQLRASVGRTREPILVKFGTQQQIKSLVTVAWSKTANINTKNLEVLSLLRPILLHIYNSKNHLVSSSTSVGHGCNIMTSITSTAHRSYSYT